MIISHKNKYVFIQNEMAGSSSIGTELKKKYDGEDILWKHAKYEDFLKVASPKEKEYFVFSSIRNPVDVLITEYVKIRHADIKKVKKRLKKRSIFRYYFHPGARYNLEKRKFTQKNNLSFEEYFNKFLKDKTFNINKRWTHKNIDAVIKLESLDEDFKNVINKLGLEYKGKVKNINKTQKKDKNTEDYYPENKEVFEKSLDDSMKDLGYEFPSWW